MNRVLPECLPCVMNIKDPKEQLDYIFFTRIMLELGFIPDTTNNVYTKVVDGSPAAYLTTLYSKEEIYDYIKGCVDKGFQVTSGERIPSLNEIHAYQQALMQNSATTFSEVADKNIGIGLYLSNYLDIINERNMEPEQNITKRGL